MKLPIGAVIVMCLASFGSALHAQSSMQTPRPLRAASQPPVSGSPAVQAAENARAPGAMRSEQRPVPQLSVPLKRRATRDDAAEAAAAASRPGVDDATARCLARKTALERASCSTLATR